MWKTSSRKMGAAISSSIQPSATSAPTLPEICPAEGASCNVDGTLQCSGTGFAQCSQGSWVVRSCGAGTACVQDGQFVYCGYEDQVAKADAEAPCGGKLMGTVEKRSTQRFNATLLNLSFDSNIGDQYDVQVLAQSVNETSYTGSVTIKTLTNTPIGSKWSLNFTSNLNVTSAARGQLQHNGDYCIITSDPSSEPENSMAIIIPFRGTM
jgi:hypothetical protein